MTKKPKNHTQKKSNLVQLESRGHHSQNSLATSSARVVAVLEEGSLNKTWCCLVRWHQEVLCSECPSMDAKRGKDRSPVQKGPTDMRAYNEAYFTSRLSYARTWAPSPMSSCSAHGGWVARCLRAEQPAPAAPAEGCCLHIAALLQIHRLSPFASLNIPFGSPEATRCFDCTLTVGLMCRSLRCAGLLYPPPNLLICNLAGVCLGAQFGKRIKSIMSVLPVKSVVFLSLRSSQPLHLVQLWGELDEGTDLAALWPRKKKIKISPVPIKNLIQCILQPPER